jgi:hypothetical protein
MKTAAEYYAEACRLCDEGNVEPHDAIVGVIAAAIAEERARCVRLINRMDDAYGEDGSCALAVAAIERGDE